MYVKQSNKKNSRTLEAVFVLTLSFLLAASLAFLAGCGSNKTGIKKTYEAAENGPTYTYYEMEDGTWQCKDKPYSYRLVLTGRMHSAEKDSTFVVLTDDSKMTFEEVANALYNSDSAVVEDFEKKAVVMEIDPAK